MLGVHKNTVRNWIKGGLLTIDNKRPFFISGQDLITYLQKRKEKGKQKCGPGELYCVRCRLPRIPSGRLANYSSDTDKTGNLAGTCPICNATMNRRVSLARIEVICGDIEIVFPAG